MSDQDQFFDVAAPVFSRIACIAVTSTSGVVDLSSDAYVGPEFSVGSLLRFYADGSDVYVAFSTENASTIDETATGTSAGKCIPILAGTWQDFSMSWLNGSPAKYLYTKTKSGFTSTLRIVASSRSFQNKNMQ